MARFPISLFFLCFSIYIISQFKPDFKFFVKYFFIKANYPHSYWELPRFLTALFRCLILQMKGGYAFYRISLIGEVSL